MVTQKNSSNNIAIKWEGDYSAYGILLTGDIENLWLPLKTYALHEHDTVTGLIYAQHRWYDPETAQFISEDPIKDGLNYYAYCGNNPIGMIDPLGLYDEEYWKQMWDDFCIEDIGKDLERFEFNKYFSDNYNTLNSGLNGFFYGVGKTTMDTIGGGITLLAAIAGSNEAGYELGDGFLNLFNKDTYINLARDFGEKLGTPEGRGEIAGDVFTTALFIKLGSELFGSKKTGLLNKVDDIDNFNTNGLTFAENDLVLALDKHWGKYIESYGGKYYYQIGEGQGINQIRNAMDKASNIRFAVDDFNFNKLKLVDGSLTGGIPNGGFTTWEMWTIKNNPSFLNKTIFYENGVDVSSKVLDILKQY